jgi:hypothetical protein
MLLALQERCHEMLTVPHGDDDRKLAVNVFVEAGGFNDDARGFPDQAKIICAKDADDLLPCTCGRNTHERRHLQQSHSFACARSNALRSAPDTKASNCWNIDVPDIHFPAAGIGRGAYTSSIR